MAADIRPYGPSGLALVGQALSGMGSDLLKHQQDLETLQKQGSLEQLLELQKAIAANPIMAPFIVSALGKAGVLPPGYKPSTPSPDQASSPMMTNPGAFTVFQDINSAKNPQELPSDDQIGQELQMFGGQASTPNPDLPSTGYIGGLTGTPGFNLAPSGGLSPTETPATLPTPVMAALSSLRDSRLNFMSKAHQQYSQAGTQGDINAQTDPANALRKGQAENITTMAQIPAIAASSQARGSGYEAGRLASLDTPAGQQSQADTAKITGFNREMGSQQALNDPTNIAGATRRAGSIAGAEENARQAAIYSPENQTRQLGFLKNKLILESAATNDREAADRANIAGEAATRGTLALNGLRTAWQNYSKGLTGGVPIATPQAAQLNGLSKVVAGQLAAALGIDPKDAEKLLPTSWTAFGATGDTQLNMVQSLLATSPLIQRDTAGMPYGQKLQVAQQISQAYQAALATGKPMEDPLTHQLLDVKTWQQIPQ